MKKQFGRITTCFLCLYLLLVIFDSKTASLSTKSALDLCMMTVVPSIFPLLFISSAIAARSQRASFPRIERLLHIPNGTSWLFLIGLLCGYPVGGKLLQDQIDRKFINKESACRMMAFCNNAGPAFIIGILSSVFSVSAAITMWLIQIISSFLLGMLLPAKENDLSSNTSKPEKSLSQIMTDSLKAIGTVCGWVIVFGVLNGYIDRISSIKYTPVSAGIISGFLELTNGILKIQETQSKPIAFIICAVLLSFGGICVILQTKSVASDLKTIPYIFARVIHAGISGTLATLCCIFLFSTEKTPLETIPLLLCTVLISVIVLFFNKKVIAFQKKL